MGLDPQIVGIMNGLKDLRLEGGNGLAGWLALCIFSERCGLGRMGYLS